MMDIPNDNPRLWHKACFTPDRDLLIFGGCCNDILSNSNSNVSVTSYIHRSSKQVVVDVNRHCCKIITVVVVRCRSMMFIFHAGSLDILY